MDLRIRRADLEDDQDLQHIVDLTDEYAQDPMGGGEPLPEDVRERLPQAMRDHGSLLVWLAFDDGGEGDAPVGVLTGVKSWTSFAAAPALNTHDIHVSPSYRGRGIGRALLDAAEAFAREHGWGKLTLEVLPDNPAKRLYERAGYAFANEFWTKAL